MQDLMPPVNTPDKLFHDGDPTQGIEGTIVTAEFLNNDQGATRDIQQELINVLAAAAMQPDPAKQDQLVTAIRAIINAPASGWVQTVNGVSPDENGAVEINIDDIDDVGTAAKGTVVTSQTDTTAGRLLNVGWQGFGSGGRQVTAGSELVSGIWRDTAITKSGITLPYDGSPTLNYLAVDAAKATAYVGHKAGAGAIVWNQLIAADGGTITGNGSPLIIRNSVQDNALYLLGRNQDNTNKWYIGNGNNGSDTVSFTNYLANNSINLNADGTISINGKTRVLSALEVASTSSNSFRSVYGNYGTFWRQDGTNLYLMLTDSGEQYGDYNSLRPFAVNLATGAVTIGKLGLADYSNFDARYAGNSTASKAANGWWQDESTGLIFQWVQGATTTGAGNQTVTFPKAFPNACLFVNPGTLNAANSDSAEQNFQLISKANANCVVKPNYAYGDAGSVAALIFAVGY